MQPGRSSLEAILRGSGINLEAGQYDRLWAYHRLLRAANEELNLTRIHSFEAMVLKHYVDSLLVLRYTELPSPLVDMGSGPGLPGIPLKIVRPDVTFILAEPRGARVEFLGRTIASLRLDGVEVFAGKVGPRFPRSVAGVITRAVAPIPETLDRVAQCLVPGGRMIFMKGPGCDPEIVEARATRGEAFRLIDDHAYQIPGTSHDRRLVIFERSARPVQASIPTPFEGPVREVSSAANPTFKVLRDLLTGRGIRKHAHALISGTRTVAETLDRHRDRVTAWLTEPDGSPPPDGGLDWLRLARPLFRELDTAGTHAPMLLVTVPEMPAWSDEGDWPLGCTLFVPFQDPENVGAVLRSAAAFGVARAVLLREAAHPFHPRAARAAGPALFQLELWQGPSIRDLRASAVPLLALAADGMPIAGHAWPERFGLVPGVEGPGLPDHLRDGPRLRIPIAEGIESLNAASATAIALYEWRRDG